ncbi:juvenile hormone acid O-methyltransferase-like [Schistocerca piceifrons]|uniref:juvenile hormone acid O-methyltransferase-like n=1 Tax=Schistocerca piceifrons TaxID=274613 RepID=UPI001F5F182F|nr:juvenile hormone acid O-methyltransferase-like [Schistocerca piceifrons]
MNDAELYAKSSSPQQQFVNKVLEELWPVLEWRCEQGTVLDVGCGAGDVTTHELLPRLPPGVSVLAVDINPAMVAKAADRFSGPRLRFRQLDIGTPRIEETDVWRLGPFRKVFSFFCLHWVQDQRIALQNISKLLSPGGETLVIIVIGSPLYKMFENLATSSRWSTYMTDYRQFETPYLRAKDPVGELTKYLHEAGFCVKTCRSGDNSYSSMDEQDLINTVTAINPFVGRIPQQLQEAFMQDCVTEAYRTGAIRAHSLPNGTVYSHSYSAMVAHAIKS